MRKKGKPVKRSLMMVTGYKCGHVSVAPKPWGSTYRQWLLENDCELCVFSQWLFKRNQIEAHARELPPSVVEARAGLIPASDDINITITPKEPGFDITSRFRVTRKQVSDLLCSALEGGSNYWYMILDIIEPKKYTFRTDEDRIIKHLDAPLNEGGSIRFKDIEAEGNAEVYTLALPQIERGLNLMATNETRHFDDFLSETRGDATTGDIFLQLCLFGEVIYG